VPSGESGTPTCRVVGQLKGEHFVSILSKIFIVLLVVLCIATAVATVIIQKDAVTVRPQLQEISARLEQVSTADNQALTELNNKLKERQDVSDRLNKDISDQKEAVRTRETRIAELTRMLDDANKALVNAKLDLTTWTALATRAQTERAAAEASASENRTKLEEITKLYAATNQRLAEVSTDRDFLLRQVGTLKEQIALLNEQAKLQTAGAMTPARTVSGESSLRPVATGPTIKGKILKVEQGMATIDVGANDGVQENMEFTVYRGKDYLGDLIITRVHAAMAVGRLARIQNSIQEQDRVSNNLASN
jgi:cell division protein FtsL